MILALNKKPTPRDITWFAVSLLAFFGILGGLAIWKPEALVGGSMILGIAWLVSLIINRDSWHLQILGVTMPLLFFAIGGSVRAGADPWSVATITWIVGAVLAAMARIWLKFGSLLYSGWMLAAFPVGWTISHVILGITYFLVLTPIGLIMRMMGRDPMQRALDRSAKTYWIKHETPTDAFRYFQQF
jgi:Saxitoxin biosynthesis operon protein SxtJ